MFRKILFIFIILILFIFYFLYLVFVPNNFDSNKYFKISSGENIYIVSKNLYNEGYIKSPFLFRIIMSFKNKDRNISAGLYLFEKNFNLLDIVSKLSSGKFDAPLYKITIPEGYDYKKITEKFIKIFPHLNKEILEKLTLEKQGFLFPETYYFDQKVTEEKIINTMYDEFKKRFVDLTEEDIILASIIEGEANNPYDMQIVSGILKERLKINMPLQVDVEMETYKKRGLPKRAINNPGENAIYAVLNPIKTEYLYYLTGKDGKMYYAKTYQEHKKNINKYLR